MPKPSREATAEPQTRQLRPEPEVQTASRGPHMVVPNIVLTFLLLLLPCMIVAQSLWRRNIPGRRPPVAGRGLDAGGGGAALSPSVGAGAGRRSPPPPARARARNAARGDPDRAGGQSPRRPGGGRPGQDQAAPGAP